VTPAALDGRPGVAAFDFDGTLVAGDSLAPFLGRLLGRRRLSLVLGSAGPAMLAGYRSAGRDGAKAALLRRAVAGLPAQQVREVGASYGHELAARVVPAMARRLDWHRHEGHALVLVSASLADYLEPFGAATGFGRVIATRLEVGEDGCLTGRLHGANVRGPEKAARLRQEIGDRAVELWAYGDSDGDRQMLAMADHPCRVSGLRPRPR
jgi:phosphatidylglycerophosphatase C